MRFAQEESARLAARPSGQRKAGSRWISARRRSLAARAPLLSN
jgi:hypothetical protein